MINVNFNLVIDRHPNNGSARLKGRIGSDDVDVRVSRDSVNGHAVVRGDWGPSEKVDLTIFCDQAEGYNRFDGHLKGQDIQARLHRALDGDANMTMGSQRYQIDRDSRGEYVQLRGTKINGDFRRDLQEGDESGEFRHGERIGCHVDRDPVSGNFDITGRSSAGPYKLHVKRSQADGDLQLSGTLPQGSESFPLLWEVLGDDKNIPDNIPFYPSCLLGMSLFLAK